MKKFSLTALSVCTGLALFVTSGATLALYATALLLLAGLFQGRVQMPLKAIALLALLAVIGTAFVRPSLPTPNGFLFEPQLSFSAGLFSILGTTVLLARSHQGWEELLILVTTITTLLAAGNTSYSLPLGYVVGAYGLFLLLYLRARTFGLQARTLFPVPLTLVFAVGLGVALNATQPAARTLLNFQGWWSSVNFGDVAGIKPQSGPGGTKVLLRVFSDNPEHYLAGRRYVTYREQKWLASEGRATQPTNTRFFPKDSYLTRGPIDANWSPEGTDRVELTTLSPEALLLPLQTRVVQAPLSKVALTADGDLLVKRAGARFSGSYSLVRGALPVKEDPQLLAECLKVEVSPQISELAQSLTEGQEDDKLKVFVLAQFFQQNFEYGFGYPFDQAEDPVAEFLEKRPAAHCEVFATTMTLMTRSVGVPARYVQGFLLREKNDWGGYWVSRERDAHAWVEVYLEGVGWVTVDPTPPGVSEEVASDSSWSEFTDYVKRLAGRAWAYLSRGPQAILGDILALVSARPWIPGLLILGYCLWRFRGRLRRPTSPSSEPTLDPPHPNILKIQHLLRTYQQRTQEEKPVHLTLLEWAERVEKGGAFLRFYSRVRYTPGPPTDEEVEQLAQSLPVENQDE